MPNDDDPNNPGGAVGAGMGGTAPPQVLLTKLSPDGGNTWTTDPNAPAQMAQRQQAAASTGPAGPWSGSASGGGKVWGDMGTGAKLSPLTYGQIWQGAQDPYRQQGLGAIQGMQGQMLQGYGPGGTSLAGLTSLGHAQNAQAATIDTGQSQNLMGGQVANINALNAAAQGQGPSVAAEVARQQGEANTRAQMATLGSQRGASNSALGIRAAQDSAAANRQGAAQNAALGRANEAMAARQQLGGALTSATGQAQSGAQAQAQLSQQAGLANAGAANQSILQQGSMDQQTKLANLNAQLQAGQLNDNEYNAYVQALMAQNQNDWGAQMNALTEMMNNSMQAEGIDRNQAIQSQQLQYGLTGAGISAGAAGVAGLLTAVSDRRAKTNVQPADRSIKSFLSKVGGGPLAKHALMGDEAEQGFSLLTGLTALAV
jgi:hypothetical protein